MKIHRTLLACACSLLLAGSALAQHTPPNPAQMAQHQVQRYTALLSLNAEQQTQATTIFTTEATSAAALMANEKSLHAALKTAITNNDAAAITQTATSLGQINGQMIALRATTQANFYQLLSGPQKEQMSAEENAHVEGRGPGAPGMWR
jgi:Spy/CpxP family protein refolding chaperone